MTNFRRTRRPQENAHRVIKEIWEAQQFMSMTNAAIEEEAQIPYSMWAKIKSEMTVDINRAERLANAVGLEIVTRKKK